MREQGEGQKQESSLKQDTAGSWRQLHLRGLFAKMFAARRAGASLGS